jgi:hypothetical protein
MVRTCWRERRSTNKPVGVEMGEAVSRSLHSLLADGTFTGERTSNGLTDVPVRLELLAHSAVALIVVVSARRPICSASCLCPQAVSSGRVLRPCPEDMFLSRNPPPTARKVAELPKLQGGQEVPRSGVHPGPGHT